MRCSFKERSSACSWLSPRQIRARVVGATKPSMIEYKDLIAGYARKPAVKFNVGLHEGLDGRIELRFVENHLELFDVRVAHACRRQGDGGRLDDAAHFDQRQQRAVAMKAQNEAHRFEQ